ncbi:transporter substrate-binding domain-containing protein [Fulvivirgaceae bacterium BMA10]|uniref:Transporter substrate-binding domain-containing protein n=1 Tax=Splendidivirga corallicola TaxID=3051826 RepID=A0ABT8KMP0_9BACT|nr:transporter substrate-binding domain-containing protein [Fulvivirgaceae bacterium BMA10]
MNEFSINPLLKFSIAILFLGSTISVNAQLKGDTYAKAKAQKKGVITYAYVNTPGFIEKSSDGKMKGLLVETMKKFEEYVKTKEGIALTVKFVGTPKDDFKKMMDDVKQGSGGVFGLSNITITQARMKYYRFSPAYISNKSVVVSNKSVPTLTKLNDISSTFKGKEAIIIKGGTYDFRIQDIKKAYYPTLKVGYLPSEMEILKKISQDQNAFTIVDFIYYLRGIQDKLPIKRHPSGDGEKEEFGVIMPKSNDWSPLLKDFFNSGFLRSSEYRKIIADNLGTTALQLIDSL